MSVYRPCDGSKKYEYCGETVSSFYDKFKIVAKNSKKYACVIAGDFNTHFSNKNKNFSKKRLEKLTNILSGFKNMVVLTVVSARQKM